MGKVPVYVFNQNPSTDNKNGLVSWSENPVLAKVMEERRRHLRQPQDQAPPLLDRILLESRVLIVEGISGSGKDTFQTYLKRKLKGRDVYEFSEGEVLHSWKQLQIEGIAELRIKFMTRFANYVKNVVTRDENAVFLLNRFHLSTYASTIHQQPELAKEYDEIINVLRILQVHVFILQLDVNEIEKRSMHPERSGAWQKFQRQIVGKDGFRGRLESQQQLILEAAKRQQIPYSVIKVSYEPEIPDGRVRISEAPSIVGRGVRINAIDANISKRKRHLPPIL
jgi:thymidylate kinase